MTGMIELVDKDIKREIITIFHKFKELDERFKVIIRNMEDITKTQIELLKLKTTMSAVKNIVERLIVNQTTGEKFANIQDIPIKIIQSITEIEIRG